MSIFDLLSSLSAAPGAGFGAAGSGAADVAAAGASSPPACMAPPPVVEPDASWPSPPGSWDRLFEPDPPVPEGSEADSSTGSAAAHQPGSERFLFPESGTRDYVVLGKLKEYGDWIQKGSPGERAAKAATGLVVLPVAAVLACAEDSFRSPIIGGGPSPAPSRR